MNVKSVSSDITKYLSTIAGMAVGQIVMGFVPSTKNAMIDKVLPGAIGLTASVVLASKSSDPHVKAGALGIGIAGTAKIVNNFTLGKTGILAKINMATSLPEVSLDGLRGLGDVNLLNAAPAPRALPSYDLNY